MSDDRKTCGCCKDENILTPASTVNLPVQKNLAFRIGTHGSFKAQMKADLSRKKTLPELTSREDDDPSFALIDAWACVLDALTFYQERIANESYLLTATERLSVLNLARAIGYELKPGVAASTFLAFTLDEAAGSPGEARIDIGTKVMSIPGQDEKPQTFETIEKIEAKAAWNELKPRLTEPKIPGMGIKEFYLKGAATGLKPGDGLLFVGNEREQYAGSERWDFRLVKIVNADNAAGYTQVTWDEGLGWQGFNRKVLPAENELKVYAFRQRASIFGFNAPDWRILPDAMKANYMGLDSPDELTEEDKKEWPSYCIYSPKYPLKYKSGVISYRTIKPTPESVASAATAAAQAMVTEAANNTVSAATASFDSAVKAVEKLVDVTNNAKKAVENVAKIAADGVKDSIKQTLDSKIGTLCAVNEPFGNIKQDVKKALDDAKTAIDSRKTELDRIIHGLGTIDEVVPAVMNAVKDVLREFILNSLRNEIARNAINNVVAKFPPNYPVDLPSEYSLNPADIKNIMKPDVIHTPSGDIPTTRPIYPSEAAEETIRRAIEVINHYTPSIITEFTPTDGFVFSKFKSLFDTEVNAKKTALIQAFRTMDQNENPIIWLGEFILNNVKLPSDIALTTEETIKNVSKAGVAFGISQIQSMQDDIERFTSEAALIASNTAAAATQGFDDLTELGHDIESFVTDAKTVAGDFVTSASAARSAAIVAAATQVALKLPLPPQKSRLDFVYDAAVAAAKAGSLLAENDADGAKAVLAGAGLSGAGPGILIPLGVAAVVAEEFKPQAKAGADKVQEAVKKAVDEAKKEKIEQESSESSKRPQYEHTKDSIDLDTTYKQIATESWAVLSLLDNREVYKVKTVSEASRAEYSLIGKTTRLKLEGENLSTFEKEVRPLVVYAQSEQLDIAQVPLIDPVQKDTIALNRAFTGLTKDKMLILSGKRNRAVIKTIKKGMNLVSLDDPGSSKEIEVGDSFYVLDPPSCNENGDLEWHLMDRKGFAGRIIEESKDILIVKGAKQAKVMTDGLILISDDMSKFISLEKNTVLVVLDEPPFVYSDGHLVWHLRYKGTGKSIDGHVAVNSDRIVFSPAKKDDPVISEVVSVKSVFDDNGFDVLTLNVPLINVYDRKTVVIHGNVARATHGETKTEVLGNGDASKSFQKFILKQTPLTYISSSSADGAKSTLAVRVNDILWDEEKSLYWLDRKDRAFITQLADDGTVTIKFGDGKTGARLPTGSENVNAIYRVGMGMQGMVKARQLSLLINRPLGVQGVMNPLAPTGAEDPEKLENARRNAPMKVLTLDRVVSLTDYEDFTRAFSGIGKASSVWLWGGEIRYVHITIASADGKGVDNTSDLYKNLWKAIDESKDPVVQFRIDTFTPLTFDISARILVNEKYIADKVFAAVKDALNNAFSFARRNFGQMVTESEINAVIQRVEGVVAVDINEDTLKKIPHANIARLENNAVKRAELLTINPDGIDLSEMKI